MMTQQSPAHQPYQQQNAASHEEEDHPADGDGPTIQALPPMLDRFTATARPVLAGFVPGVVSTVNSVVPPTKELAGFASPAPLGLVGVGPTVRDTGTTAFGSSGSVPLVEMQTKAR